jgi:hypothetical protein
MKLVTFEESEQNIDKLSDAFCDVPGRHFKVRGKDYFDQDPILRQNKKVPSGPKTFTMDSVKLFSKTSPVNGQDIAERMGTANNNESQPSENLKEVPNLVIAFAFSKFNLFAENDYFAAAIKFSPNPSVKAANLAMYKAFVNYMSDEERREVLKFGASFSHLSDGLSAIMATLGARRPVIIGRRLDTEFFRNDNTFVIVIDICSNIVTTGIRSICFEHSDKMIIDLQFILEVKKKVDLPENSLVGFRFHKVNIDDLTPEKIP